MFHCLVDPSERLSGSKVLRTKKFSHFLCENFIGNAVKMFFQVSHALVSL